MYYRRGVETRIGRADEAAVTSAIEERKIDGALVAGPAGATLIVVPAAGTAGASALGTAFSTAAAALRQKMAVVPAHPLPPGDASGAVSFFVVMALIVGGYLSSTIALAFGGQATRSSGPTSQQEQERRLCGTRSTSAPTASGYHSLCSPRISG